MNLRKLLISLASNHVHILKQINIFKICRASFNSFKIWQKFYCREQIAFDEKNHNNNNLFGGNWTESRDHDFLQ